MLGKMFVHELKQSWRVPVLLCIVAAVLSVIVKFATDFMGSSMYRYEAPSIVRAVLTVFLILYFVFMVVTNFLVFLLIPVRFYRESYSNIGYLTHCLPVEKSTILWAHILSGGLWLLLYLAIDFFCIDLLVFRGESLVIEIFRLLFGPLMREIRNIVAEVGAPAIIVMVLLVLSLLLTPFRMILNSFCAVSLGQIFKKHRIAGAVGMYYLIGFATGMINSVFFTLFFVFSEFIDRYDTPRQMTWYVVVILAVSLLLNLIETVVFYYISKYRMSRRLNLE